MYQQSTQQENYFNQARYNQMSGESNKENRNPLFEKQNSAPKKQFQFNQDSNNIMEPLKPSNQQNQNILQNNLFADTPKNATSSQQFNQSNKSDRCYHHNILYCRKCYCKDCSMFQPKSGAEVFRESQFKFKLVNNPDQVYDIMKEKEHVNRSYNPDSYHLVYRKALVDWICEIGEDLKFSSDTIHVAIQYIDTVLSKLEVPKNKLQLICLSCLIIAAKFSEAEIKVPSLKQVHEFCRGTYTLDLIKKSETLILQLLDWNLKTVTPYQFTQFYLSNGCAFSSDESLVREIDLKLLRYLRKYAEFFVDLSLQDYKFSNYKSHILACAAIAGARKAVGLDPLWPEEMVELAETEWEEIEECFDSLYCLFEVTFPDIANKANSASATKSSPNSSSNTKQVPSKDCSLEYSRNTQIVDESTINDQNYEPIQDESTQCSTQNFRNREQSYYYSDNKCQTDRPSYRTAEKITTENTPFKNTQASDEKESKAAFSSMKQDQPLQHHQLKKQQTQSLQTLQPYHQRIYSQEQQLKINIKQYQPSVMVSENDRPQTARNSSGKKIVYPRAVQKNQEYYSTDSINNNNNTTTASNERVNFFSQPNPSSTQNSLVERYKQSQLAKETQQTQQNNFNSNKQQTQSATNLNTVKRNLSFSDFN